ncbi:hypothetical protein [Flaviaesturariibacter terrae]
MSIQNRALVLLAAYDYESLAITLQSLPHTVDPAEKIVVVVNGRRGHIAGEKTERVAREWALEAPNRYVVRPLRSGLSAYQALTEAFAHYEPLKNVQYICKIDDDLIPLRRGWVDRLDAAYGELSAQGPVGFVTGLINNNSWGFAELVTIFGREEEYKRQFDYVHVAGDSAERRIAPGAIDTGVGGSVWTYPYLAWWIHQWTTLQPAQFVAGTQGGGRKQIPADIHYSIGCIFFEKSFWLSMDVNTFATDFDEKMLHYYCKDGRHSKWALLDEPMIHLFYRTQRQANAEMLPGVKSALAAFFGAPSFEDIKSLAFEDILPLLEESLGDIRPRVNYIFKKLAKLSFMKKWREKRRLRRFVDGQ